MSLCLGFPIQPMRASVTLQSIDVRQFGSRARKIRTSLELEGHGRADSHVDASARRTSGRRRAQCYWAGGA